VKPAFVKMWLASLVLTIGGATAFFAFCTERVRSYVLIAAAVAGLLIAAIPWRGKWAQKMKPHLLYPVAYIVALVPAYGLAGFIRSWPRVQPANVATRMVLAIAGCIVLYRIGRGVLPTGRNVAVCSLLAAVLLTMIFLLD
jgi:hypothetical protein